MFAGDPGEGAAPVEDGGVLFEPAKQVGSPRGQHISSSAEVDPAGESFCSQLSSAPFRTPKSPTRVCTHFIYFMQCKKTPEKWLKKCI